MPFWVHAVLATAFLSIASEDCSLPSAWNILSRGVLVMVSIAVMIHQLELGEERVCSNLQFHSIPHQWEKSEQECRAGMWREEMLQRSWGGAAYSLAPYGLPSPCFLLQPQGR